MVMSVLAGSLARTEAQDEFGVPVDAQERVLLSPMGICRFLVLLLAVDKRIKLLGLNVLGIDVADGFVVELEATRTNGFKDVQNGFLVQACQSGRGPDAHSLTEQADNLGDLVRLDSDAFERLRFAECFAANRAAEAAHDAVSILEPGEVLGLAATETTLHLAFLGKVGYPWVVSAKICDLRQLTLPVGCAPRALKHSRSFVFGFGAGRGKRTRMSVCPLVLSRPEIGSVGLGRGVWR